MSEETAIPGGAIYDSILDNEVEGAYTNEVIQSKTKISLKLQSPLISTRSSKEKAIDNDITYIGNVLDDVSLGVFNSDGVFERSIIQNGEGEVISLDINSDNLQLQSAATGIYTLSLDDNDFSTTGEGTGLVLQLAILNFNDVGFFLSIRDSSIVSGGTGFAPYDELIIPSTSLGGSDAKEVLTLTLLDGAVNGNIESYAGIIVDAMKGVILYGPSITIDPSSLPTEDPLRYGALWNNLGQLMISQGLPPKI